RRRWPWALVAVVVAVMAAAGALALAGANAPRYTVPSLRGMTLAQARAEVADEGFTVKVAKRGFDEEVPKGAIVEQDPSVGTLREGSSVAVVVSEGPEPRPVPDLTGLDQAAAEQRLRDHGFVPNVVAQPSEDVPKGIVLSWAPSGTDPLPKGVAVTVTVSGGPRPREIPDVAGTTYEEAAQLLAAQGLKAARAEAFSNDVPRGRVISTRPGAGKPVERDSTVTVVVSKGPDTVAVPDVVGKSVGEATAAIEAAGLQVSGVGGKPKGQRVFLTDPQPGTRVQRGSGVFLFVR
ncbi:MAG: PASTA domain-containing protein, partial [Actinomycetota bacterium]|nr:PASTA domain-containing protein [Actinomycetota bacterium]